MMIALNSPLILPKLRSFRTFRHMRTKMKAKFGGSLVWKKCQQTKKSLDRHIPLMFGGGFNDLHKSSDKLKKSSD